MKYLPLCFGVALCLYACEEPPPEKLPTSVANSPSAEGLQEKPYVNFSLDKQNIVYIGFDNPVSIRTNGLKDKDIEITTSAGLSYYGGRRNGILRGQKQGAEKTLPALKRRPALQSPSELSQCSLALVLATTSKIAAFYARNLQSATYFL